MKIRIFLLTLISSLFLVACDAWNEADNKLIQKPYEYTELYYQNLREYKARPHQVFYGWFAGYGNKEGQEDEPEKQSAAMGEHFKGLPDSMDFCSLWAGIPNPVEMPIAYDEMRKVRKLKDIKMLLVTIVRIENQLNDDGTHKFAVGYDAEGFPIFDDTSIVAYANDLVRQAMVTDENGEHFIDGIDLDYEPITGSTNPRDDSWLVDEKFTRMVQEIGKHFGPMAETEYGRSKYLVVDYYNHIVPKAVEPYINYLIRQAYTQGFDNHADYRLQTYYDAVAWLPTEKFIVTENFGEFWTTGGSPYVDMSGNAVYRPDGQRMYSLEGMARWNPTQGAKGGFGAFYFERDYNHYPPFEYVRDAIQIANPAQL